MKRAPILTGTALALVMAAAQAQAAQPGAAMKPDDARANVPLVLAQAEEQLSEEELLRRQREAEEGAREEAPAAEEQAPAEEPAEEQAPAEEAPPAAEEAPAPAEEPAPEPEPEPAPEPQAAPEPEPEPEAAPRPETERGLQFEQEDAPEEAEPAPAEEAPAEAPAEEPVTEEEPPAAQEPEQAPAAEETPAPEAEQPAPTPEPAPAQEPSAEQPAEEETPQADEPGLQFEQDEPAPEAEQQPEPADEGEPVMEGEEAAPEAEEPPAEGEAPAPAEDAPDAPADEEATGEEAPILDSQKEGDAAQQQPEGEGEAEEEGLTFEEEAGPPPTSDSEAQQLEEPVEVESLRAEEGRRIERRDRRERREGTDVLREIGDRFVIQLNNQVVVQSDDRERIGRDADEVYYEELPRGRVRETVVRSNGVQVVTVRDRYGDVVRRSRIMPDGQEYVLVYTDRRDREEFREWRDPARDLPPLRLTIPRDEYILDARRVQDEDMYYQFLDQPPVELVRRLYTVDEVKYSARVRDSVRRVDLDTITFEFGSASISESEIPRLEGVASAMERLLEENPAETFLIEGHTDAVGSDEANLALSDQRAESVAIALTNVFAIPPENLVTQGYGETYLKVDTEEPARENRRVAIRRITPLVSPVASR